MKDNSTARERRDVLLSLIDDPRLPSRTTMDEEKLAELKASIRKRGFISVIVVVRRGDRFEVVAGHRRTMAAREVGLVTVPCVICEPDDPELEAIQFDENAKREDLSVTDEAIWFRDLLQKYPEGGTDGVATRTDNTRTYVEGRLALLSGCEEVFAALAADKIKIGVAERLNRISERAYRLMCLDMAVRGGCTVGQADQWLRDWQRQQQLAAGAAAPAPVAVSSSASVANEWQRCRVCGNVDDPGNRELLTVHNYCVRPLLDPQTGLFRARADFVAWPLTADDAHSLIEKLIRRFPELVPADAARD